MSDETYDGALYPPNKEPLIIRCNGLTKTDELDALQKTLQKQAGDKPVVLLPWNCEVIQSESRWILCSEKLPKKRERVLSTIFTPHRGAVVRSGYYIDGAFYNDNGDCWMADDEEVVAWMPLPQPWEGGQDG